MLLYADDVVLLAESEKYLPALVDFAYDCCLKWGMKTDIFQDNSNALQKQQAPPVAFCFSKYGDATLETVNKYKYQGVYRLGGALEGNDLLIRKLENTSFETYNTPYRSGVEPIVDYGAGVWSSDDINMLSPVEIVEIMGQ